MNLKKLGLICVIGGVIELYAAFILAFLLQTPSIALFAAIGALAAAYGVMLLVRVGKIFRAVREVEKNYNLAQQSIEKSGLKPTKHYSSFGHKWIEYRTQYKAKDNLHIELDEQNKKIIVYMLEPYYFNIYDYSDVVDVNITIEDGAKKITYQQVSYTFDSYVESICVTINFKDGTFFNLSANDNAKCYVGDAVYQKAISQALELQSIIKKQVGQV